jgi:hypothetical protein
MDGYVPSPGNIPLEKQPTTVAVKSNSGRTSVRALPHSERFVATDT